MAKQPNNLATERITLSITPQMLAYLEQLLQTGLYGKNPAEAAESVLREELRRLVEEGRLQRIPSPPASQAGGSGGTADDTRTPGVRPLRREA